MKGRAPTKAEKDHMNAVAELGCIVCKLFLGVYSPCSIHHVEGRTKPGAHFKVLGLCGPHHQTGGYGTALHAGKKAFERNFDTEENLMIKTKQLLAA